jgi:hypothetical protein
MSTFIFNGLTTGVISGIFGSIFFSIIVNSQIKNSTDKLWINNKLKIIKKYRLIEFIFFLIGIFVYLLLEYFDFNKWYCQKVCIGDQCTTKCVYKGNHKIIEE